MTKKTTIRVQETDISVLLGSEQDYFSLTDIAKRVNGENPAGIVINWLRLKDTIEFLGTWETLHNPDFNLIEFDKVKSEAGTNRFILSVSKWVETTGAVGITTKAGRHGGGTFAHKDLAKDERLVKLNEVAIYQLQLLAEPKALQEVKQLSDGAGNKP